MSLVRSNGNLSGSNLHSYRPQRVSGFESPFGRVLGYLTEGGMVWDPSVPLNIYFVSIRDGLLGTIFAMVPTSLDGFPGSRIVMG